MIYKLTKPISVSITYKNKIIGYCESGQVIIKTSKDLNCAVTEIEGDFELPEKPINNKYLVIPQDKTEEFLQKRIIDPKWFSIEPEFIFV